MAGIFISYRRDEARHAAGRLADDLVDAFGAESIFRDIEGIEPGVDFSQALDRALAACVVMLVLIGPRWLALQDNQGRRRIDVPGDWIRVEIATALKRDTRVIPVLLEGAELPAEEELPEDLRPLVRRQAFELTDGRWRGDLQRLVDALARVPGLTLKKTLPPAPPPPRKRNLKPWLAAAVVGLLAVAWLDSEYSLDGDYPVAPAPLTQHYPEPAPQPEPEPAPAPTPPAEPRVPDVSGMWRTYTGEVYYFDQQGRNVEFTAEAAGQQVGLGQGRFDGQVLRLAMTLYMNGMAMGMANCELQPSTDNLRYTGMCNGPNGLFQAQMFR